VFMNKLPSVLMFFSFDFLSLSLLRSHNFLIFYAFVTIFNASMRQEEGFDFSLDAINK
jgi:hypothetical protein